MRTKINMRNISLHINAWNLPFLFNISLSEFIDRFQIYNDPPRLVIRKIQKDDQGMIQVGRKIFKHWCNSYSSKMKEIRKPFSVCFQCFVTNEWEQIQSTAELQLGGKYQV